MRETRWQGCRLAAALCLALLGLACGLEVNDLPENNPPEVGQITIDPPSSELAPLDSFRLAVSAADLDGDPLTFLWGTNLGTWADNAYRDSIVTWIAPASFGDIDSVRLSVSVRDLDEADPIGRHLNFPVVHRSGNLRVRVFDLAGVPTAVPLAVAGVETTLTAMDEYLFEDLAWGDQFVLSFATEAFHGAVSPAGDDAGFGGYPQTVFIQPDTENLLELVVAPRSVLLVPGLHEGEAITEIQAGIDLCAEAKIDSLLLRDGLYSLPQQGLPDGGSAAIRLSEADLTLSAFPGEGPILLDAAAGLNDFGFYLSGRGMNTRIEGITMTGAASSGAYLHQSSGVLLDLAFEQCGSAALFLSGDEADTLRVRDCVLRGQDHGVSLSGGILDAEGLLVENSLWYGIWLRDGAAGSLRGSTIVESELVGLFLAGGQVDVERCLLANNGRGIFRSLGDEPLLECNLLWNNEYGDYGGVTPGANDLLADPLFCDPDNGDWRLDTFSPALTALCGPIGAFGDCDSERAPLPRADDTDSRREVR